MCPTGCFRAGRATKTECPARRGLNKLAPCDRLPTVKRIPMKNWLTLMIVASASLLIGADAATYVGHDKVAEALAKGGPLGSTKDYTVSGSHRDKAGQVEVH